MAAARGRRSGKNVLNMILKRENISPIFYSEGLPPEEELKGRVPQTFAENQTPVLEKVGTY